MSLKGPTSVANRRKVEYVKSLQGTNPLPSRSPTLWPSEQLRVCLAPCAVGTTAGHWDVLNAGAVCAGSPRFILLRFLQTLHSLAVQDVSCSISSASRFEGE